MAFAPGIVGYGIWALCSRVLFSAGQARGPAVDTVLAAALGIVVIVIAAAIAPAEERAAALAGGYAVTFSLAGVLVWAAGAAHAGGRRMRVVQLLGPSTGGIRRTVVTLAAGLADRGIEVRIAGPSGVLDPIGGSTTWSRSPGNRPRSGWPAPPGRSARWSGPVMSSTPTA